MQKIINITLKAIAAVLMLAAAASCVFEKDNPSRTEQQKYKYVLVQLGVSTDRMTATKADGDVIGADDEAGSTAETAIKDLRVYAYTNDGENGAMVLRGYFHAQDVDAAATATKPLLMDIKVPFEEYGTTKQVYFMAVANAGGMTGTDGIIINSIGRDPQTGALVLPKTFGFGEFADIRYSVADQTFQNGMPMYCQTDAAVTVDLSAEGTPNTEPGHNGHTKLPVTVNLDMTRSLAKIEVYAAEAAAETTGKEATTTTSVTITGVSLANVPASGNLFTAPAADASITYATFKDAEGKETAYSTSFLKAGTVSKKVNNKVDTDIKNPDNYTLVSNAYYLAENNQGDEATYDFGATDYATQATVLKIDYSLDGGKTSKPGYVKMPQIKRNTWYKVLARIQANGKAEIKVVAVSWDFNKEKISFEDIVSMTGNPNWGEGSTATTTYQFGLAADQTATCKFNLQTPKNGTWYATIEGKDIQDFAFVKDGQELKMVSGSIGTEDDMQFTIKTLTKLDLGDSRTVNIRLVAKGVDGRTYNVKIDNADYFTIKQQ